MYQKGIEFLFCLSIRAMLALKNKQCRYLYLSVLPEGERVSCWVVSCSLRPHGLLSASHQAGSFADGILQTKNTGVGSHSLLQRIFLTQGLNPCLFHWFQSQYFFRAFFLYACMTMWFGFLLESISDFVFKDKLIFH